MIEVELKSAKPQLVAQRSGVADSWSPADIGPVIQGLYPRLVERMGASGLPPTGTSMAWYEDTADGQVSVHATFPIAERPAATGSDLGFDVVELPAVVQMATTLHHGSMDSCDTTVRALLHWIDQNGLTPAGYSREVDIECGPDGPIITEIQQAVVAK